VRQNKEEEEKQTKTKTRKRRCTTMKTKERKTNRRITMRDNEEERKGRAKRAEKRKTKRICKSSTLCDIMPCRLLKVHPTFRRNMSPPTSGTKNMPTMISEGIR
jgi:hypothetical protein